MAAASFDDIVAITGFTICIGLAMDTGSQNSLALSVFVHGPVSVFIGVASGIVSGILLAMTRYCSASWMRSVIAIELAVLMTFGYKRIHFDGCGAIATLVMGVVAHIIWKQQRVKDYTQLSGADFLVRIGMNVNVLWDIIVRPLLFGSIGAAFDTEVIPKDNIFKSIAIVITGLSIRILTAFFCTFGNDLTHNERFFVCLSWTPKATVQAALAALPLAMIRKNLSERNDFDDMIAFGESILATAILAIVITAPLGLIAIQIAGPMLLSRTDDAESRSPQRQDKALPDVEQKKSSP